MDNRLKTVRRGKSEGLKAERIHDGNAVSIPGEPTIMIKEWPQKKKSRTLSFGCSYRVYLTEVVKDIEMAKALK